MIHEGNAEVKRKETEERETGNSRGKETGDSNRRQPAAAVGGGAGVPPAQRGQD